MQLTDPTRPAAPAAAPPRTARNGAHAVFDVLRQWNVDLLFTCPGSTEAAVLDASLDYPEMRLVLTTHESVAVAAADAYSRVTGTPAVAYLHANVGLANGVAHLACAWLTRSPLLVLNGMKPTEMQNRGGFTTSPFQMDPIRQYVRESRIALRTDALGEDLTRTLAACTTDPAGPAYLGLPQDLVEAPFAGAIPDAHKHRHSSRRRPDPHGVQAAARLLGGGRAVTMVAGVEIAQSEARRAFLALAERLDAVVLLEDRRTLAAAGVLGDTLGFAGGYAPDHPAVAKSDVILFAGMPSFTEFEPIRTPIVPPGAKAIHLSAEPGEVAKFAGVDIGLVGNAALALDDLHAALDAAPSDARRAFRSKTVAAFRAQRAATQGAARARFGESPIQPATLCHALDEVLPPDCYVVGDAVTSQGYLVDAIVPGSRREFLTTAGGSLGWGMSATVGVQLAKPDARVVGVIGDGVFQFGIQTLWTAQRLGLPITFVVIDNRSYAAVKAAMKRYRTRSGIDASEVFPAAELPGPDIAAIARGFGAFAETIDALSDLRGALDRAFATDGPSVVVVKTDVKHTGP